MKQRGQELGFEVPDLAVDGEVIEADPPTASSTRSGC